MDLFMIDENPVSIADKGDRYSFALITRSSSIWEIHLQDVKVNQKDTQNHSFHKKTKHLF